MKTRLIALLALGLSGTALAHDEQGGHTHWWLDSFWYAGAALGQNTFKDLVGGFDDASFSSRDTDDRDMGMRLFGGAGFGRYVAVELGYADLGKASFTAQSDGSGTQFNAGPVAEEVEIEGIDLALLGRLPLADAWALFGKVGYLKWDATYQSSADLQCCGPIGFKQNDHGNDLSFGAGVQYDGFAPMRVVAEYGTVNFSSDSNLTEGRVGSFGISLAYLFQ